MRRRAAWAVVLTVSAAAVQAREPCPAADFIVRHRAPIAAAAARHGVPAIAIAGVIAAESTLNRSTVDRVQDAWLATQLALHDDRWWDDWARSGSQQVERVTSARWIGNKWPVSLIASGYVMSFGPAQIQPRTALRACAGVGLALPACGGGTKALMRALLDEAASIDLAGLVLQFEAKEWAGRAGRDVRRDVAFLATLYSSGADYVLARQGPRARKPNRMGTWLQQRMLPMRRLLQGDAADRPATLARALCEVGGGPRDLSYFASNWLTAATSAGVSAPEAWRSRRPPISTS